MIKIPNGMVWGTMKPYRSEHGTWYSMIRRCTDESDYAWKYYGGRGITVCERWRDSFENFLDDMGQRPPGLSLDRIDNNGHYEPGNCRWVSRQLQAENRTKIHQARTPRSMKNGFRITNNHEIFMMTRGKECRVDAKGTALERLPPGHYTHKEIDKLLS